MNGQSSYSAELGALCAQIRELIHKREYAACEKLLGAAMQKHPHAPHPHNLYGLLFEARGNHRAAMNHFRAAWALDAAYKPAEHNLHHFGTFYSRGKCAYDETDCADGPIRDGHVIERDANGIGHVVRRKIR